MIRHPLPQRACAPFFFGMVDGQWRLDPTRRQRAIRFGRSNTWRLDPAVRHGYEFAFEDWSFDTLGFPRGG